MLAFRGVAVAPHAPEASNVPTERPPRSFLVEVGTYLTPLYRVWEWLQTSHCGQYSVERLLTFDEYCQRVSRLRAVLVCLLTPLSAIITVVLTECVPLRPASDGALKNYMFWARHAAMVTLILLGAMKQAQTWIPGVPLTRRRILGLSVGCAVAATLLDVVVAGCWVFPVPFLVVLGAPVLEIIVALAVMLVVGRDELSAVRDGAFHFKRYVNLFSAQTSLMLIYPAYHALFLVAPDMIQRLLLLLLPGVSLALKNVLVSFGSHLEDQLPEQVVFVVDVFDALYTTLCMRTVNSYVVMGFLVLLHSVEMLLSLRSMHRRSRLVQSAPSVKSAKSLRTLVVETVKLLQTPTNLDPLETGRIRLLSGMRHGIADASAAILHSLASHSVYQNDRLARSASITQLKARYASATLDEDSSLRMKRKSILQVLRDPIQVVPVVIEAGPQSNVEARRQNTRTVNQTLHMLFNNEYLGLVAYVQCVIPVLYMVYIAILQGLPNRVYYPGNRNVDDSRLLADRMVVIGLLALCHFLLLVVLHKFVAYRFSVSTLYQVAFVLETHALLVQPKLTAWLIFSVGFQLEHYGADFSFKFSWIH
ncbi:hypothetical protein V7S43_017325 [Phytophthora oleae]|uniref:Uncharacterized protein n=1 Tax=Phytophthora oleae TaxID=2107226 RepID=A0ABD3ETJ7_9STRA